MDTRQNATRVSVFLGFAFGMPWAAALAAYLAGLVKSEPLQAVTLVNYVFILSPALATVFTRLVTKEGWRNFMLWPNFKRGWRCYLAAWLLPLLAAAVGGAIFYLVFPQAFDPSLDQVRKLIAGSPSVAGLSPWLILLSVTLSMMLISAPVNAVVSLGEELGWRAYLLPRLAAGFTGGLRVSAPGQLPAEAGGLSSGGALRAALLVGLIHGVWHWPLFLMSASFDPGSAFPFPLVYLVFTCSMSVLLSWAALRSGSVWPAALGHGTINPTAVLAGYLAKGPGLPLLGPTPTGLIGGLGYLLIALALVFSRGAFAGHRAAEPAPTQAFEKG